MPERIRSLSPVVAALGAGLLALSCGGDAGPDRVVGPAAPDQPIAATDAGAVTASAQPPKQAVCHYDQTLDTYSTLNLSAQGAAAHITHHAKDYAGACVVCPCFGPTDFATAVAYCETQASWGSFCAADPDINGGVVVSQVSCPGVPNPPFVYRLSVDTNADTCSRRETVQGTTTETTLALSPAQETLCRRIIEDNCEGLF